MIKGKKGGILIYMLGMITLLSIVVTEFLLETASAMRFRSQMAGRQDLEIIADSALETSLAVLAELKALDKGLFSPAQGWDDPMEYFKFPLPEGYTIKVTINDETGKLSIYDEDLTNFGNLLVEMGYSFEIVSNLKSELKKYLDKLDKESTDKKNDKTTSNKAPVKGKEDIDKTEKKKTEETDEGKDKKEKTKKKEAVRTLFNLEQLKEIPIFERTFFDEKGNPNDQFKVLKQNVSVLNTGKVNINTAPELVKKLLIGTLNTNVSGKKYLTSMRDFGPTRNKESENNGNERFGFNASIFDIEIEVARGPIKYHLGAIMEDKKPAPKEQKRSETPEDPGSPQKVPIPTSNGRSEEKSDFSFLALTEDDSSIN